LTALWTRIVLVSMLATAAACSRTTPLDRLLAGLENTIEDRDAVGVAAHLAPEFKAENGMAPAAAVAELKRYFLAYESLDVAFSEATPEGEPPQKLSVRVDMSGKLRPIGGLAGMLPDVAAYRFDLDLVARDGKLLIAAARWQRVDRVGQ
jgi:hypothetical protein